MGVVLSNVQETPYEVKQNPASTSNPRRGAAAEYFIDNSGETRMSMMKQISLLPAGCQPWNNDVCGASVDRFAYCSTLAVYIYQLDRKFNEYKLFSIMSEHKRTITAFAWNHRDPDLIACAAFDLRLIIWNVALQKIVAEISDLKNAPCCISWCPHEREAVAFISGYGALTIWNYSNGTVSMHKDAKYFGSEVSKFRWHPKKIGKIAFGHVAGSISVFCPGQKAQKEVLEPEALEDETETDPVVGLEWDQLSTDYLLVANLHNGIRLIDTESLTVIMNFVLPSAASCVHTLSWIPTAPGMFLTGDKNVGVLRVWNVSKPTPLENIRVKKTGFHSLHVLGTGLTSSSTSTPTPPSPVHTSGSGPSHTYNHTYALPPGQVLCTFMDGGVGLYDLSKRSWIFIRDMGHIETIFDCEFKPDDADLLATGSFDGTIKVWNVNTMTAEYSSTGNEGVIYSISWAPGNLDCIAASTSKNGAFIWDVQKAKVIQRFNEHAKGAIYNVSWNQQDSSKIASCGHDGYCIVQQVDGTVIQKFNHPAAVFGCDWNPHTRDMIATGCEDGKVRVFYMASGKDIALKIFSGHTAKVFHIRWSPLRDGILCSSSDDCTVRVWDYPADTCMSVLNGHTSNVRGLLWNTEVPYLLISGSWDHSIRVWDVRDGACIDSVWDHGADVYGLTCHPSRPFTVASSSRDSTLRIWTLAPLVTTLQISVIAQRPWDQLLSTVDHSLKMRSSVLLAGKMSNDIRSSVDKTGPAYKLVTKLKLFSLFLMPPQGTSNLWNLVSVMSGTDEVFLPESYWTGIVHRKHLMKVKTAEAQQLEMFKMSKFGGGIGSHTKEERLRDAAGIYLRLGQVQKYCEIMVELGEWDKALSVAPGVSMQYWNQLSVRRMNILIEDDNESCIPYCVATDNTKQLIDFYTNHGLLWEALLAAEVTTESADMTPDLGLNKKSSATYNGTERDRVESVAESPDKVTDLMERASSTLADWYFNDGQPCLSACCHLAVENSTLAMSKLLRGNELELVISLGLVLGDVSDAVNIATELLARRCERFSRWDLTVDLLVTVPNSNHLLAKMCARYMGTVAEIDDLHEKAGLPSLSECEKHADLCIPDDPQGAIKYYLLSANPVKALDIGLPLIKEAMQSSKFQVEDVHRLVDLMSNIRSDKLSHESVNRQKNDLLSVCGYVGVLLAVRQQYDSIVSPLFTYTIKLLNNVSEPVVPVSKATAELDAWITIKQHEQFLGGVPMKEKPATPSSAQEEMFQSLMFKSGDVSSSVFGPGIDRVSSSHLPCHSDAHVSCLTSTRIQGPLYYLEDGQSVISLNEALMWAKVNPFSPIGTTDRINPF